MSDATKKRRATPVKRFTMNPRKNFFAGRTVVLHVDGGSRPWLWIGTEEYAGLCSLTRSEMVELYDALGRALRFPEREVEG